MLCNINGCVGFLLWYKDPVSLEEEFRPPIVNALRYLVEFHNCGVHVPMYFFFMGKTESSSIYTVEKGFVKNENGYLEFRWKSTWIRIDIISYKENNDKILTQALQSGYPDKIQLPQIQENRVVFCHGRDMELHENWFGSLIMSRYEVSRGILYFIMSSSEEREKILKERYVKSCNPRSSLRYWAYYPSPKPASIMNFLNNMLSGKIDNKELGDSEVTGLMEGFYRMGIANYNGMERMESSEEKPEQETDRDAESETYTILYDDNQFRESEALFNKGCRNINEPIRFLPSDAKRGALSVAVKIAIRCTDDSDSNWGLESNGIGKLFLLPLNRISRWYTPIRSPRRSSTEWKVMLDRHQKNWRENSNMNKMKSIATHLSVDAHRNKYLMLPKQLIDSSLFGDAVRPCWGKEREMPVIKKPLGNAVVESLVYDIICSVGSHKKQLDNSEEEDTKMVHIRRRNRKRKRTSIAEEVCE